MKTKIIIFDFDGTLADTHELIIRTNQEAMKAMNYPVRDEEAISKTIGLPLAKCIQTLFPDRPRKRQSPGIPGDSPRETPEQSIPENKNG